MWVLHLNEINSFWRIKEIKANVINSDGDIEEDSLVRYGPFNMVKNRSFVKTDIANNAYSVLQKQPDRSLRRQFRSHLSFRWLRSSTLDQLVDFFYHFI
ncbi:MAG: hypothetical protein CM15mP126_0370 [Gammaproteobacteria bacterium]|nr:MAG: hypothetical protein CM15mP126_0370 [Gammaproteobacteria bacterium]